MTARGLSSESAPDHPRVRASLICPLCNSAKASGLIACWPCFRSSGLKDCDPAAERRVATREAQLTPLSLEWVADLVRIYPPIPR
jgi:hypothetical protein